MNEIEREREKKKLQQAQVRGPLRESSSSSNDLIT